MVHVRSTAGAVESFLKDTSNKGYNRFHHSIKGILCVPFTRPCTIGNTILPLNACMHEDNLLSNLYSYIKHAGPKVSFIYRDCTVYIAPCMYGGNPRKKYMQKYSYVAIYSHHDSIK